MAVLFRLVAFAATIALTAAAAEPMAITASTTTPATTTAAATSGCISATHDVNFDGLPTGTLSPTVNYHGLLYDGWEVVETEDTVFKKEKSTHLLKLVGSTGTIKTANAQQFYLDDGGPSSPSFYFGCANKTHATGCDFAKVYNVPGDSAEQNQQDNTYQGYFNAADYPDTLEAAGSMEQFSVHNVTWNLYNATGGTPPSDLKMYIAFYKYTVGYCED